MEVFQFVHCEQSHWNTCVEMWSSVQFMRREQTFSCWYIIFVDIKQAATLDTNSRFHRWELWHAKDKSCNADNDGHNEWNVQQIILVQFLPNIFLEITSQDAGSDLQFVVRFVARMGESQCNCISLQLAMPCQWLDYHRTQTHQIFHISRGIWDEKCFSIYCTISLVITAISCHQQIHAQDQQIPPHTG